MSEHPIDPVEITLSDGVPRKLRYTNAAMKRIKAAAGAGSMQDLMARDFIDVAGYLIFEGLAEKDGLTAEQIDDLIPFHLNGEIQVRVMAAMAGKPIEEIRATIEAEKNAQRSQSNGTAVTQAIQ